MAVTVKAKKRKTKRSDNPAFPPFGRTLLIHYLTDPHVWWLYPPKMRLSTIKKHQLGIAALKKEKRR